MRDEIEDYQRPSPHLLLREGGSWLAFMGDDLAELGEAVALVHDDHARFFAVVSAHAGAGRARLWAPAWPTWVEPGVRVERSEQQAALSALPGESVALSPDLLIPWQEQSTPFWPEAPTMSELDGRRAPLVLGIEPLDIIAPLVRGGTNLVIDTLASASHPSELFAALVRRARTCLNEDDAPTHILDATGIFEDADTRIAAGATPSEQVAALRLAVALGASLRNVGPTLNILSLPTLQPFEYATQPAEVAGAVGLADLIDLITTQLVSTHHGSQTTLLYLGVPPHLGGLGDIIETLDLGAVDAQLVIDHEGRFTPGRSLSRADLDDHVSGQRRAALATLAAASLAEERAGVFGRAELEDDEREQIDRAAALKVNLSAALAKID